MFFQRGVETFDKISLLKKTCTNIYADRKIQATLLPFFNLLQSFIYHPFVEFNCQGVVFDIWKEGSR